MFPHTDRPLSGPLYLFGWVVDLPLAPARGSPFLLASPPKPNRLLFEVAYHRYTDWRLQGSCLPSICPVTWTRWLNKGNGIHLCRRTNGTVISRAKIKKRWRASLFFVLEAVEMNGDFALSQGREEAFSLILSSPEVGECSAKKNCYSHQLVGMGLLKHLSKEGFGREPLEFCHSQTLLFEMTMLAAGCTYLCEGEEMKFHSCTSIKWERSSWENMIDVFVLCHQSSTGLILRSDRKTSLCARQSLSL